MTEGTHCVSNAESVQGQLSVPVLNPEKLLRSAVKASVVKAASVINSSY